MNKLFKSLLAIFGGVNFVFGIFIPISVALLSVKFLGFNGLWSWILIIAAVISMLYKAINVAFVIKD